MVFAIGFILGGALIGFVLGVEYWKRKSILGYENGFKDAQEVIREGEEN